MLSDHSYAIRLQALVLIAGLAPQAYAGRCTAIMELEYSQRNTTARVSGTIQNEDCTASDGEYKLTFKIRDANGELKTLEFLESWQRQDDQPVELKGDYPIGENVDLVNVRAKMTRCTCPDTPEE